MADEPAMLDLFEALALSAGRAVMAIYACDFSVEKKSDASPVTAADRAADFAADRRPDLDTDARTLGNHPADADAARHRT